MFVRDALRYQCSPSQEVALLVIAFVAGKAIIATACALVMRFPAQAAWLSGIGLAQFGEFGFVLMQLAIDAKVVDEGDFIYNSQYGNY